MLSQTAQVLGIALLFGGAAWGQNAPPPPDPGAPKGVEVQARGPVHEAFATPLSEAQPTPLIQKKPPLPIEEMAPEEQPEGDAAWIKGYWAWDDERHDFLWVSGCWRIKPVGKEWMPGYWRDVAGQWQWVPGFWTVVQQEQQQQLTYYPQPPAPPQVAPPPTAADEFYVPGYWMWHGDRYVWRAGYATRVRPGYVYVASHYRWTPSGYVFIHGYWDYAIAQRGLLYAPVVVDPLVVGPTFVYTPRYAVTDTLVMDSFFVRPAYGHYYFGDYYGTSYVRLGYEPVVVYSRRYYEPIIVYRQWEYRSTPRWLEIQVALHHDRSIGRAPLPPRTLMQQNTIIQNNITVNNTVNNVTVNKTAPGLAPASTVLASRGQRAVPLDTAARAQAQQTANTSQQTLAASRLNLEKTTAGPATQPRVATLNVPANTLSPGKLAPKTAGPAQPPANPAGPPKRDGQPVGNNAQKGSPLANQTNVPGFDPKAVAAPSKIPAPPPNSAGLPAVKQAAPTLAPMDPKAATPLPKSFTPPPNSAGLPAVKQVAPAVPPVDPKAVTLPKGLTPPPNGPATGRPDGPARPNLQTPPRPKTPPARRDEEKKK
jgi:hypothetical protein